MDDQTLLTLAILLIAGGAILQGIGFVLALRESDRFDAAVTKYRGDIRVYPLPARARGGAFGTNAVVAGELSVEDRLAKLEEGQAALTDKIEQRAGEVSREADQNAETLVIDTRKIGLWGRPPSNDTENDGLSAPVVVKRPWRSHVAARL